MFSPSIIIVIGMTFTVVALLVVALSSAALALPEVPAPILASLVLVSYAGLHILDTAAGVPILWPLARPFMRPFKMTPQYARIKSKFSL